MTERRRTLFDWIMFCLIHLVLVAGISIAGFYTYSSRLGWWVAASAFIAGCVALYLYHHEPPGGTLMHIVLVLAMAANAAYLVHNGARAAGVEAFNNAKVRQYEAAIGAAARANTRAIARAISTDAQRAAQFERLFGDGVAVVAAGLAFAELAFALIFFAAASRRQGAEKPEKVPKENGRRPAYINGRADGDEARPN